MPRSLNRALAALLLALILAACATFQPAPRQESPLAFREVFPREAAPPAAPEAADYAPRDLWFVEFHSLPMVEGGQLAALSNERAVFAAAAADIDYEERFSFSTLFNGLSLRVAETELAKLAALPGVKAVYPVNVYRVPETQEIAPQMEFALGMTGADVAQTELGLSGAGISVGIIDSGIDYNHPDLGAGFGPGARVVAGFDFVGDDFDALNPDPERQVPNPNPDPMDCMGHGTHVAGIAGASGQVTGVAPGVTFGAYKVFGCEGTSPADIIIAAMEMALADGMDIVNLSLGATFDWPQYPTAVAADRLVDAGVVVVASIGNSGDLGVFSSGAPGNAERVIGVASFENLFQRFPSFVVTSNGVEEDIGYEPAAGSTPAPTEGSVAIARTGTPEVEDDACAPLPPGSLEGQAALIRRGTCTFAEKALNAQNAGAEAVVIYNNVPGRISITVAGAEEPIGIPVVSISQAEGLLINDLIVVAPTTLTWTDIEGIFENPTANLTSGFSSYGLTPDLQLKPDIGAPGGFIYSTIPLTQGGYATLSGTSMSSPYVAGAVALLLEARPGTTPMVVRDILQNSANPHLWSGNPELGFLEPVHRQGAGMLDIPGAILSTTTVTPGKLSVGESEEGPFSGAFTETLTIRNAGDSEVTYTLSHDMTCEGDGCPVVTFGDVYAPEFGVGPALVFFNPPQVTVPAGGSARVAVTIQANPGLPDRTIYGGYIVLTPEGNDQILRVPFAGFKGDYQSYEILTPTVFGLPAVTRLDQFNFDEGIPGPAIDDGHVFTLQEGDLPLVLYHLNHHAQVFRLEILPLGTRSWIGDPFALEIRHDVRNATPNGFFTSAFSGATLPDGQYRIRITVLRALGNPTNPNHVETWTSPVFTIARPD
jgi:minor extracellular serine protease Vpr